MFRGMKTTLHKSNTRGEANHGWLKSHHTFSFAGYHNPERMSFGALRVLNDDRVSASQGFGTHPHDNMEIVSVVLDGALRHKDTMGNEHVIKSGEVQIMSAGTGVAHSEYNNSDEDEVSFLQIWVFPEKRNIEPRYAQKDFSSLREKNKIQIVVSPDQEDGALPINQNSYFSLLDLEEGHSSQYNLNSKDNGVYIFVLDGEVKVAEQTLEKRDGLGVEETDAVELSATKDSKLLFIEVPMAF
jgi:redox-sensitive bicupin YhaK (pirin superfamily)